MQLVAIDEQLELESENNMNNGNAQSSPAGMSHSSSTSGGGGSCRNSGNSQVNSRNCGTPGADHPHQHKHQQQQQHQAQSNSLLSVANLASSLTPLTVDNPLLLQHQHQHQHQRQPPSPQRGGVGGVGGAQHTARLRRATMVYKAAEATGLAGKKARNMHYAKQVGGWVGTGENPVLEGAGRGGHATVPNAVLRFGLREQHIKMPEYLFVLPDGCCARVRVCLAADNETAEAAAEDRAHSDGVRQKIV